MLNTILGQLRILAFIEGMSFLILLFICMPLKYMYEMPQPTKIVGMAHGVLFIAYCAWVFMAHQQYKWKITKTFWALLASLIPFGTFVADVKLFREEKKDSFS